MAIKRKAITAAPAAPPSSFDQWQQARRGSEVAAALAWRTAYLEAVQTQSASPDVMKTLMDGQSKERSLWKYLTDEAGRPFTSFAAFSAAPPPAGLGTEVDDLRRLRRVFRFHAVMDDERPVKKRRAKKR